MEILVRAQAVNNNNGYETPFVTVMTCGTGDFDEGNSQTEEFVKLGSVNNPEGAVAAIGLATTGDSYCL